MTFKATAPGGSTITATVTAWYATIGGTLQRATLGQYASGLGVCDGSEACTGSSQGIDNKGNDEFLLFQFSAPMDPTSIALESPANGGLDVSYWLGSTTSKPLNLTNMNVTNSLSTLGFGSQNRNLGTAGSTRTIDFGGAPTTSVNAVLFGGMYGYSSDYFDIFGMSGSAPAGTSGSPFGASVPEPASIFLLFTIVLVAGLIIHRRQRLSD